MKKIFLGLLAFLIFSCKSEVKRKQVNKNESQELLVLKDSPNCDGEHQDYKNMTNLKDLAKIESCFQSFEKKKSFYRRVYFVSLAENFQNNELKGIEISKKQLIEIISNLAGKIDTNDYTYTKKSIGTKDTVVYKMPEDRGYFLEEDENLSNNKLIRFKDYAINLFYGNGGGYLEAKKITDKTFTLKVNWGGKGSAINIITYKNGKFIVVGNFNPNEFISKSLDVVLNEKTDYYDREFDIQLEEIKGEKYFILHFRSQYDAQCCFSYAVAYNTSFDYNGKFYYKKEKYDNNGNLITDDWKEVKLVK